MRVCKRFDNEGSSPLTRGKPENGFSLGTAWRLIPAHAGKTRVSERRVERQGAHPRSRGENLRTTRPCFRQVGSSPLTRGKLLVALSACDAGGLIPAHAGKTPRAHQHRPRPRAHPRSRGENVRSWAVTSGVGGSSPLTRGKHPDVRAGRRRSGLIPAHAGKTTDRSEGHSERGAHPRSRGENPHPRLLPFPGRGLIPAHAGKTVGDGASRHPSPAHPRSRGENGIEGAKRCVTPGSSPLTRGKRACSTWRGPRTWLIPAHAGKTRCRRWCRSCRWAHPRSRGENVRAGARRVPYAGSSPLTRGKQGGCFVTGGNVGLIPAHAGKTSRRRSAPVASRAHPRSRGENRPRRLPRPCRSGSSPLTRGKPRRRYRPSEHRGLIPAHAGKTGRTRQWPFPSTAHPRSRGENAPDELEADFVRGSSPLTRGKQILRGSPPWRRGLIPAHAGKTSNSARPALKLRAHPRSRGENSRVVTGCAGVAGSSPLTRGKLDRALVAGGDRRLIPAHAGKTRVSA